MWLCNGRIERLNSIHRIMLDEKEHRIVSMNNTLWLLLQEKEARLQELSNLQDTLLQKLQASETAFKVSLVIVAVVALFVVYAGTRLWKSRDQDIRHLQTQVTKYEGTLHEKEQRIQELLETTKGQGAAVQTAAAPTACVPSPAHHFVYALPGLPSSMK